MRTKAIDKSDTIFMVSYVIYTIIYLPTLVSLNFYLVAHYKTIVSDPIFVVTYLGLICVWISMSLTAIVILKEAEIPKAIWVKIIFATAPTIVKQTIKQSYSIRTERDKVLKIISRMHISTNPGWGINATAAIRRALAEARERTEEK